MPYLSRKIKIQQTKFDRRLKLTDLERLVIIKIRENTDYSFNKIAKIFSVSKRLIQFICNPDKLKANIQKRMERGGTKIYYNKEKNRIAQKKHRIYKQRLLIEGKIKID